MYNCFFSSYKLLIKNLLLINKCNNSRKFFWFLSLQFWKTFSKLSLLCFLNHLLALDSNFCIFYVPVSAKIKHIYVLENIILYVCKHINLHIYYLHFMKKNFLSAFKNKFKNHFIIWLWSYSFLIFKISWTVVVLHGRYLFWLTLISLLTKIRILNLILSSLLLII